MTIISDADLASYLRDQTLLGNDSFSNLVSLTNELVTDAWADPVDPVPIRVRLIGLKVAARAWVNDPTKSHLESLTRGADDATRTERYRSLGEEAGVYLTAAERAVLRGSDRANSVRLVQPGDA